MEDPGKDTAIVLVKDRNIVVRRLGDVQLTLMAREARLAQRDTTDGGRRVQAVARCYDILESAVVQDEDREYLMDLVVSDEIELKDLMTFVSVFKPEEPEAPKVRRGRPARRS